MEVQNKVSVFIGNFSSEEKLQEFIKESFTEDGDMYSLLMDELGETFIDNQFLEVYFSEKGILKNILSGFSYSENFISQIEKDLSEFNSIILLYNFEFKKIKSLNSLNLLGVFDYR